MCLTSSALSPANSAEDSDLEVVMSPAILVRSPWKYETNLDLRKVKKNISKE